MAVRLEVARARAERAPEWAREGPTLGIDRRRICKWAGRSATSCLGEQVGDDVSVKLGSHWNGSGAQMMAMVMVMMMMVGEEKNGTVAQLGAGVAAATKAAAKAATG